MREVLDESHSHLPSYSRSPDLVPFQQAIGSRSSVAGRQRAGPSASLDKSWRYSFVALPAIMYYWAVSVSMAGVGDGDGYPYGGTSSIQALLSRVGNLDDVHFGNACPPGT